MSCGFAPPHAIHYHESKEYHACMILFRPIEIIPHTPSRAQSPGNELTTTHDLF